jgi:hypothetical protein
VNLGRAGAALLTVLLASGLAGCQVTNDIGSTGDVASSGSSGSSGSGSSKNDGALATKVLATLSVKGRAASTGYSREQFGTAWKDVDQNGCDTRDDILRRDLSGEKFRAGTKDCVVIGGTLADRYTGKSIKFTKEQASEVQIDHVVALENAWATGAGQWSKEKRTELANDPLNLLAADGSQNESKGSGDAATWLPPNKSFRCDYVARQIAVKSKYGNWVTSAEKKAMSGVLKGCPDERIPTAASSAIDAKQSSSKSPSKSKDVGVEETSKPATSKNDGVETPGAYCSPEGAKAKSSGGDALTCSVKKGDERARWRSAA